MNTKTILDLDSILDTDMGKVETLPDYVTPAPGTYALKVEDAGVKERKGKEGKEDTLQLVIEYSISETIESAEPPFPNGSRFTERFTATEDGMAYFKKQAMKILNTKEMDGVKMREIFDGLKGTEFGAVITHRISKGADGKDYTNVNIRPVHEAPAS